MGRHTRLWVSTPVVDVCCFVSLQREVPLCCLSTSNLTTSAAAPVSTGCPTLVSDSPPAVSFFNRRLSQRVLSAHFSYQSRHAANFVLLRNPDRLFLMSLLLDVAS